MPESKAYIFPYNLWSLIEQSIPFVSFSIYWRQKYRNDTKRWTYAYEILIFKLFLTQYDFKLKYTEPRKSAHPKS